MKPNFPCTAMVTLITLIQSIQAGSQDLACPVRVVTPKFHEPDQTISRDVTTEGAPSTYFINNIPAKAIRYVMKNYEEARNMVWDVLNNGFRVYLVSKGVRTKIVFSKNGAMGSVTRYLDEDKFPRPIHGIVKQQYADFIIGSIREVTETDKRFYLVDIRNENQWKSIHVTEKEILD